MLYTLGMTLTNRNPLLFFVLLLAGLLPPCQLANANEKIWDLLRQGGQVVAIRHTQTAQGSGDPPGFKLDDCATQRNLNDEGRAQARRMGAAFRDKGIPIAAVISSPWCRCLETARLAFGEAEPWSALSNLYGRPQNEAHQSRAMRERIAGFRGPGNLVLVSHGVTIRAATGTYLGMGEFVVLTPRGSGKFDVVGTITVPAAAAP
jgi:broad specificity phosphatase PhoE